jgi:uncharacterized protein (DUF362 family)
MIVTSANSMKIYRIMAENPPVALNVPMKSKHLDPYKRSGKNVVSIVSTDDRKQGIRRALELIGGVEPMTKGLKGNILIKPNCNTDDPYPRDTHYNTVRSIAEILIDSGISPVNITVGDMSGRARGLPTRVTMENLGITKVTEDLGLNISYFEEEEWVNIESPISDWWPYGLKIPRTVYEADRIIFTPILRSHSTATFTCSLKLGVGLIDAKERDWLHNGENFYEKMMDINLAYQVDLVIADVLKMNTGFSTDPEDEVEPKIITASNNMVASDAVSAALMHWYGTVRVSDYKTHDQIQFKLAEKLELGKATLSDIEILQDCKSQDKEYPKLINFIKSDLR